MKKLVFFLSFIAVSVSLAVQITEPEHVRVIGDAVALLNRISVTLENPGQATINDLQKQLESEIKKTSSELSKLIEMDSCAYLNEFSQKYKEKINAFTQTKSVFSDFITKVERELNGRINFKIDTVASIFKEEFLMLLSQEIPAGIKNNDKEQCSELIKELSAYKPGLEKGASSRMIKSEIGKQFSATMSIELEEFNMALEKLEKNK